MGAEAKLKMRISYRISTGCSNTYHKFPIISTKRALIFERIKEILRKDPTIILRL